MAITIELFEDTGVESAGRGSASAAVNNIGWKADASDESVLYSDHPIIRPIDPEQTSFSYHKYNFIKISGTYGNATRLSAKFTGDFNVPVVGFEDTSTSKVRLYYKVTSTYETPTNLILDGTLYDVTTSPWIGLNLSTLGPDTATTRPNLLATDTTYYSAYIVTQLYVEPGSNIEFGNTGGVNLEITLDEFETSNL